MPAACEQGYEDPCFVFRTLDESDVRSIRDDYHVIAELFPTYREVLEEKLGVQDPASAFFGLTDEGVALVFATLAAYEAVPYRTASSQWVEATSFNAADLLAPDVGIVCDQYVSLMLQLFFEIYPQTPSSEPRIHAVGWRRDSAVGNHAQVFVTGVSVPLLLDPNWGFVVSVDLVSLLSGGTGVPSGALSGRALYFQGRSKIIERFSSLDSTGTGWFDIGESRPSSLIYSFVAQDTAQGERKTGYLPSDFVSDFARGPEGSFYYVLTDGTLWKLSHAGPEIARSSEFRSVESLATGEIEALSISGDLWELTPAGAEALLSGVSMISSGLDGTVLATTTSGALVEVSSTGNAVVDSGIEAAVSGMSGDEVYTLDESGVLELVTASGSSVVATGIARIEPGQGYLSEGRAVFVLGQDGVFSRIDASGSWADLGGPGTLLDSPVDSFLLGLGGYRATVLTSAGEVWQLELDGEEWSWHEPEFFEGPPTAPFQSIESAAFDCLVKATQVDGEVRYAGSSAF